MPDHFLTVVLDKPRRIRFNNRARCRMASLDRPFDVADLSKPKKAFGAMCAWLWACLYEPHNFAAPEDVAEVITPERQAEVLSCLVECIKLGIPSDAPAKNDSAGSEPSPASNSA